MRGSVRIVAAAGAVAAVLAAVVLAGRVVSAPALHTGPVLEAPPPGQVRAAWLPHGEPVFIANHGGGDVQVLAALSTHLDLPVVWCPRSATFIEPGPASSWDPRGRYLGGPAPSGLAPFAVELLGDGDQPLVRVGARGESPPRTAGALPPEGPWCDLDIVERDASGLGPGADLEDRLLAAQQGERYRDVVGHDLATLPGPLPVAEARGRRGFVWVQGLLELRADSSAWLCEADRRSATCAGERVAVRSLYHGPSGDWAGWARGPFLARVRGGAFEDLAGWWWSGESEMAFVGERWPEPTQRLDRARIASLSRDGDDWVAELATPAIPRDDRGRRLEGASPVRSVPLHERVQVHPFAWDEPGELFGDGLVYQAITTEQLAHLLDERGPLEGDIELDADGTAAWLSVDVPGRDANHAER